MIPVLKRMTRSGKRNERDRNPYMAPVALLVMLVLVGQAFWLSDNRTLFSPFAISRIPCDRCQKRGTYRDYDDNRIMKMCPACFGVGYHAVRKFDAMDVLCAPCGGMGRLQEADAWRTCQRCAGRGIHRADDWKQIVPIEPAPAN